MEPTRFDAFVQFLAAQGTRRAVLTALGGAVSAIVSQHGLAASAGCRRPGSGCRQSSQCCPGARCRHRKCRCKPGWTPCGQELLCRHVATDANHCGECGHVCVTGCCDQGACHALCKDECCADCFVEADSPSGPKHLGTEACCAAAAVCTSGTDDPGDDLCCGAEEACLDGQCCCDGCRGTTACGGECCATVSCCNGACCGAGQVCARPNPKKPRKCVAGDRACAAGADCFVGEECRGGMCCSGDRLCFALGQGSDPVCCPVGEHCDPINHKCCANGQICGTAKKVRIRV
jgi:hypothetical protein